MSEQEFNESVQRELTRIRVELRLQEEKLVQQEIRIRRLENRLSRQEQQMADLEARYDRMAHQQTLIMRYAGLNNDDVQQLQTGVISARSLVSTISRRVN